MISVLNMSRFVLAAIFVSCGIGREITPLRNVSQNSSSLEIVAPCVPRLPFTVAGERGAILGRQDGHFEAWLWPVRILSNFRIGAELSDYPVPIDVNALASEIRVTPGETVITYSHAAFTIRQHMFSSRGVTRPETGAVVSFEIESTRPLEITFSFTPEMLRMWPAPNFGRPNGEWVQSGTNGFYVLHTDNPAFTGLVGMPSTKPGILPPYQERPQTYPLQLRLSFDPKKDTGRMYPLIIGLTSAESAQQQFTTINNAIPQLYSKMQDYYAHFFDGRTVIESPDRHLNEAAKWAAIAIDQMQVVYGGETGMVAGYYESGDSARPGYAWFFGRDTLWTTYAINGYGDFALTRRALDFLIRRQRSDGKIMHEFSQSADTVDWKATPYFYASADSTALLVMSMWDYVKSSGDLTYLQQNWEAVRKAYAFTRAHDSDGDGIYDNSEGTGWVESWPPGMPHQEIYLAALDQQSAQAMSHLAELMQDKELSTAARASAERIQKTLEREYYEAQHQFYAFSRNANGSLDETATIYPAVAWWDGTLRLESAGAMLSRWASSEFSTDWGTRDISEKTAFYDPISYHQGSVWPLFTGWVSLAEYRSGRSLSGYAHLMQNANLTWAQDVGSATELLSGEFYQPLGRSSSHQMWSSAMILAPLLKGLFGIEPNAITHTLRVTPHLPADWDRVEVRNVHLGESSFTITYERSAAGMQVRVESPKPEVFCLLRGEAEDAGCGAEPTKLHSLTLPLPAVELSLPADPANPGSRTTQLKCIDEQLAAGRATFVFEGWAGRSFDLPARINAQHVSLEGAELRGNRVHLEFPKGEGYQHKTLTFHWQDLGLRR